MSRAFARSFDDGARRAVIIGTDCPGITPEIIEGAFDSLEGSDFAVGPASDGGYYLIGLSRHIHELFEGIPWGTSRVFDETMRVSERLGLSNSRLEILADVDRPEDLGELRGVIELPTSSRTISVIIPTLNESENISRTLNALGDIPDVETIIVDGGSTDGTIEKAISFGARLVETEPCRAKQMNRAAKDAHGEILIFLHADTVLPKGFDHAVRDLMSRPEVALGAFSFRADYDRFGMRAIERLANMRSRWLGRPYGDQALFVRTGQFMEAGGFPEIPLMEDLEFVTRMRREGKVVTLREKAVTSARRWRERGLLRTTLLNQWILLAHGMGVSPQRLARWYRAGGSPRRH
jgi:rSAM/selenodomain-associated transferase 2